MRTTTSAVAVAAVLGCTLAGCSDDSSASGGSGAGSRGGSTTIDITIKGDSVTPQGERVKTRVDRPVTLHIEADKAGEIHVHSTPEQHLDFPSGTSTRRLTIRTPGIVDVEDHALDKVIVQLQVS